MGWRTAHTPGALYWLRIITLATCASPLAFLLSPQVLDVRLLRFAGRLWMTYHAHRTPFSVSLLHVSAEHTTDGSLTQLLAWCRPEHDSAWSDEPWMQGRNQALFAASLDALPTARAERQHNCRAQRRSGSAREGRRCVRQSLVKMRGRQPGGHRAATMDVLMVQPRLHLVASLGSPR